MRALCGAIIAAGALIGLGLAAMGIGQRYEHLTQPNDKGEYLLRGYSGDDPFSRGIPTKENGVAYVKFFDMDRGLTVITTVLILALLAGLTTAFIGLAFQHYRRHMELEHLRTHAAGTPQTHTPMSS
jgi:hypothetical protein